MTVTVAMETLIMLWKKGCIRHSFAGKYAVKRQVVFTQIQNDNISQIYHLKIGGHPTLA
jgi:hypothetical protein